MAAEWYYTTNKQQMGPVSWEELRQLAKTGLLKPQDLVWTEGMAEWVRAATQDGLFGSAAAVVAGSKSSAGSKRRAAVEAETEPETPRRRRRIRDDDDEDDEDEDDRPRKRRPKKEGMATGLKIGLIVGGVVFLLIALVCGGVMLIAFWGRNPGPGPVAGGPPGAQTYTVNNLGPGRVDERSFLFQQGQRVVITVQNTTALPNTDVDLLILRGPGAPNAQNIVTLDEAVPPNMHCRVEFVAPQTTNYRVMVKNLGPGVATSCRVTIQ